MTFFSCMPMFTNDVRGTIEVMMDVCTNGVHCWAFCLYSPVNLRLRFYLKLIATKFIGHTHIEHIKSLDKSRKGKSNNLTKPNLQKNKKKKYSVQVAVNKKKDDKGDKSRRN